MIKSEKMKIQHLFICLFAVLAWGCGDNDDDFSPSNGEKNWLILEDSEDPIDHQRYEIFKNTGIPIYYNDTIGSETRYSVASGGEYTYYEVLQVFYSPGSTTPSSSSARYALVADREKVKPVLDFLEEEILPYIPETFYVPSILLVDTLVTPNGDTTSYKGLNTVVLSRTCAFDSFSETDKKLYKGNFLSTLIASSLSSLETEWLEEEFYAVTYRVNPDNTAKLYSTGTSIIGTYVYQAYTGLNVEAENQTIGGLGFITTYRTPNPNSSERLWEVPTKEQDMRSFCLEILSYSEAEFEEKHGEYPVVMEKYQVMRDKLEEYGFTFED